jgi:hypothetical protein
MMTTVARFDVTFTVYRCIFKVIFEAVNNVDKVILASPRGFCAGVEMAIKALAWMVRTFDAPV